MEPVATKLHQCTYLTPGRRMKKVTKAFFCFFVVVTVVIDAIFFLFAVFFNMKVGIKTCSWPLLQQTTTFPLQLPA